MHHPTTYLRQGCKKHERLCNLRSAPQAQKIPPSSPLMLLNSCLFPIRFSAADFFELPVTLSQVLCFHLVMMELIWPICLHFYHLELQWLERNPTTGYSLELKVPFSQDTAEELTKIYMLKGANQSAMAAGYLSNRGKAWRLLRFGPSFVYSMHGTIMQSPVKGLILICERTWLSFKEIFYCSHFSTAFTSRAFHLNFAYFDMLTIDLCWQAGMFSPFHL